MKDTITTQEGHCIPVQYKPNPRAKRINLRFSPKERLLVLTHPPRSPQRSLETFLEKCGPWIEKQAQKYEHALPFSSQEEICLHGVVFQRKGDPLRRRPVLCRESQTLFVPSRYAPHDLIALFKKEAHDILSPLVHKAAQAMDQHVEKVTIRDQSTRWGSCSRAKHISLNWRLLLAPPEVATYVCIHEAAHLLHMNHSNVFWKLVESLNPSYSLHRKWLKQNGGALMRIKFVV